MRTLQVKDNTFIKWLNFLVRLLIKVDSCSTLKSTLERIEIFSNTLFETTFLTSVSFEINLVFFISIRTFWKKYCWLDLDILKNVQLHRITHPLIVSKGCVIRFLKFYLNIVFGEILLKKKILLDWIIFAL